MIAYGFAHLSIGRIYATAAHANLASIRVMKKLGMHFVKSDRRGVEYELMRPGSG